MGYWGPPPRTPLYLPHWKSLLVTTRPNWLVTVKHVTSLHHLCKWWRPQEFDSTVSQRRGSQCFCSSQCKVAILGILFLFLLHNSLYQRSQTITCNNRLSELPRNEKNLFFAFFFTSIFFRICVKTGVSSAWNWTCTIPVTLNTRFYAFVFEAMRVLTFNSTPCLTGRIYSFNTNWLLTAANCPPSYTALP